jgi:hypothetical protein
VATYNACLGTLEFPFGPLTINSAVSGGPVSGLGDTPAGADVMDCGPGCAIGSDSVLVLRASSPFVTLLHGHDETRFAWVDAADSNPGYWQPEPYVYVDLIAEDSGGNVLSSDFATAAKWFSVGRDGAYSEYDKFGSVWRLVVVKDAAAAMVTEFGGTSVGVTTQYVRSTDGTLNRILDYRAAAGVAAMIFERTGGNITGIATNALVPNPATSAISDATDYQSNYVLSYDGSGRLASVAMNGLNPYKISYGSPVTTALPGTAHANGMVSQISSIVGSNGATTNFAYLGDGRLQSIVNPQGSGGRSVTYTYTSCSGSAITGSSTPTIACQVQEQDQDGYGAVTAFTQFPPLPPAAGSFSLYSSATSHQPDVEDQAANTRSASGYLLSSQNLFTKLTRTMTSDAMAANQCTAERVDGPSSGSATTADKVVDYAVRCYDSDNQLIKDFNREREIDTVLQKTAHAATDPWWSTLGWASQLPLTTTMTPSGDPPRTETTTVATASGGGAAYQLTIDSEGTGGPSVVQLDSFFRSVSVQEPDDVSPRTYTYDAYGNVASDMNPTTATSSTRTYSASGNVLSSSVSVCGNNRGSSARMENANHLVAQETISTGGAQVVDVNQYGATNNDGTVTATNETTSMYTRSLTRKLSPAGNEIVGTVEVTTPLVGTNPTTVNEEWDWAVRGF